MSLRTRDFITEARAIGVTDAAIMRRHLLPNVMAPLATIGTLHIAAAIVAEASLSYLGLGVPKETVDLGLDARRRPALPGHLLVGRGLPRHRPDAHLARHQHHRRRPAGRRGPEGVPPMTTDRPTTNPILEINDLSVDFRARQLHRARGPQRQPAGRPKARRSPSSENPAVAKTATALSVLRLNPQPPCVYAGGQILFDGRDLLAVSEKELARSAASDIAMVFQDPMTSLNPLQRVGAQVAEVLAAPPGRLAEARRRRRALAALDEVGIPDPERALPAVPARALRRAAPARDDRDGAGRTAAAAHRRRADHRPRRHRAGARSSSCSSSCSSGTAWPSC